MNGEQVLADVNCGSNPRLAGSQAGPCRRARILVICFSDLRRDPRVFRQLQFIKDHCDVEAAGLGDPQIEGVRYLSLIPVSDIYPQSRLRRRVYRLNHFFDPLWAGVPWREILYWDPNILQNYRELAARRWDLIIANELSALPLALGLARESGSRVLFDAHEYELERIRGNWRFRLLTKPQLYQELKYYLPRVDAMTTVCEGIADRYRREFGKASTVITNAPFYADLQPSEITSDRIRLIHHGGANPSRSLMNLIRLMDRLDARFALDLMLVSGWCRDTPAYKQLIDAAKRSPRIRLRDPVPMLDIVRTINEYDMGIYPLPPVSFNQFMSLPNKLFEFIQARLGVAIWPSPEMARVVRTFHCGVVAGEFTLDALAESLNRLTMDDIKEFKINAHKAAAECSAERNGGLLLDLLKGLLGGGTTPAPDLSRL